MMKQLFKVLPLFVCIVVLSVGTAFAVQTDAAFFNGKGNVASLNRAGNIVDEKLVDTGEQVIGVVLGKKVPEPTKIPDSELLDGREDSENLSLSSKAELVNRELLRIKQEVEV